MQVGAGAVVHHRGQATGAIEEQFLGSSVHGGAGSHPVAVVTVGGAVAGHGGRGEPAIEVPGERVGAGRGEVTVRVSSNLRSFTVESSCFQRNNGPYIFMTIEAMNVVPK